MEDEETAYRDDDAVDRLQEHENNKHFWISRFGKDVYEAWREMYMIDVQNHLLKTLALTPNKLIPLLSPLFSDLPPEFESFHAVSRDNLISPPLTIDLRHSGLKEGESSRYKAFVKKTIAAFRQKYHRLFPLRTQVGLTVLFQAPVASSIDLDNLARRIVPFVNEELKPPSSHLLTVNPERCEDLKLRQWYEEKLSMLKRMPKCSISHYQVVQLPRLANDTEHGFVRLLLEPGKQFDTIWSEVQNLADTWQKNIERW